MVTQTDGAARSREKSTVPTRRLIDHQHELVTVAQDVKQVSALLAALVRGEPLDIALAATANNRNGVQNPPSDVVMDPTFEEWAQSLLALQRNLQEIGRSLHRLHDEDALILMEEAEVALRNGIRATGRDRQEDLRDALNLFRGLQNDVAGGRNYAVWFQIGWLQWQTGGLAEAEEAFYQASRLSKAAANVYYPYALRHLAYVQYLQDKRDQAVTTVERARDAAPEDADVHYDAARYVAAAGRTEEAAALLIRAVDLNPALLPLSSREEDIAALGANMTARLQGVAAESQQQIEQERERWTQALSTVSEAADRAGIPLQLPDILTQIPSADASPPDGPGQGTDYFSIAAAQAHFTGKAEEVLAAGVSALEDALTALNAELERPQRQMEKLTKDRQMWINTLKTLEGEARQSGFPLTPARGITKFRLRLQKRDRQAESARVSYENCKHNLREVEAHIEMIKPALDRSQADAQTNCRPLQEALDWLRQQKA